MSFLNLFFSLSLINNVNLPIDVILFSMTNNNTNNVLKYPRNTLSLSIYFSDIYFLYRTSTLIIKIMGNGSSTNQNLEELLHKGLLFYLFIMISVTQFFYCQKSPFSKLIPIFPNKVSRIQIAMM